MPLEATLELETEETHADTREALDAPEERAWDADERVLTDEQAPEEIEQRAEAMLQQWFGAEDFQTVTTYGAEIGPSRVEGFAWEVCVNGQPLSEILDAAGKSFYAESVLPSLRATGVAGFPGRTEGGQVVDGSLMTLRDGKVWVEFCQRVEHRIEWDEEFPTLPPLEDAAAAPTENSEERIAEPTVYRLDAALLGAAEQHQGHVFAQETVPEREEALAFSAGRPAVTAEREIVRQTVLSHTPVSPEAARAPHVAEERRPDRTREAPEEFEDTRNAPEPTDEAGALLPARERPTTALSDHVHRATSDSENEKQADRSLLQTTDVRSTAAARLLTRESVSEPALRKPEFVGSTNERGHAVLEREAPAIERDSDPHRFPETAPAPATAETIAKTKAMTRDGSPPAREPRAESPRMVATEVPSYDRPETERGAAADDREQTERASVPSQRNTAPEATLRPDVFVSGPHRMSRAASGRGRAEAAADADAAASRTAPERRQDAPLPFERNEGGELPRSRRGTTPPAAATPLVRVTETTPAGKRKTAP